MVWQPASLRLGRPTVKGLADREWRAASIRVCVAWGRLVNPGQPKAEVLEHHLVVMVKSAAARGLDHDNSGFGSGGAVRGRGERVRAVSEGIGDL